MSEENIPLSEEEAANATFLLQILSATVGGEPALGVSDGVSGAQKFVVLSACKCSACQKFRASYKMDDSESMVTAVRSYAMARVAFVGEQENPQTCH